LAQLQRHILRIFFFLSDTSPSVIYTLSLHDALPIFAVGWEQFFTIDWQPTERKGQPALEGMVVSRFGATATRVQLLVEGLDESGRVINQRVIWLGPSIGHFHRVGFWTPVTRSPKSRVRMFASDWRD